MGCIGVEWWVWFGVVICVVVWVWCIVVCDGLYFCDWYVWLLWMWCGVWICYVDVGECEDCVCDWGWFYCGVVENDLCGWGVDV